MKKYSKYVPAILFLVLGIALFTHAASVTPAFPGTLNWFQEGAVIEEEDWNAIERHLGTTSNCSNTSPTSAYCLARHAITTSTLTVVLNTSSTIAKANPVDDLTFVGNGTNWVGKALADCTDSGGNHLNYTAATNAFSCGTSGDGGGSNSVSATGVSTWVAVFDGVRSVTGYNWWTAVDSTKLVDINGGIDTYSATSITASTTTFYLGVGSCSGVSTLNAGTDGKLSCAAITSSAADGATKGVASFAAADFDASSGNISLDYTNGQAASASAKGFLTAADFINFNISTTSTLNASSTIPQIIAGGFTGLVKIAVGKILQAATAGTDYIAALVDDTTPDLGGDLQVHGKRVIFEYPGGDDAYSGLSVTGTIGETLAFGDVLYYNSYDSRYWRSDGNIASTTPAVAMAVASGSAAGVGTFLVEGYARDNAWAWTTVTSVRFMFVSGTPGAPVQNSPQASGDQVQVVGWLIDADTIYFQPDLTIVQR